MSYNYNNSTNMGSYVYTRNYGLAVASKESREQNIKYLEQVLPYSERHNINLYIDPGGNVSRDLLGNLKPDINKIMDSFKK